MYKDINIKLFLQLDHFGNFLLDGCDVFFL